ncbi:Hsp70 family protein [Parasphingorhabdus pacifica]
MPYVLGIHLGATATSAAVSRRESSRWGPAAPIPLGQASPTVPTVLCKVQDGSFVAGEPARQQELTHHEWVVRDFIRHVGDDAPLLVGSEFTPAQQLVAAMIEWVADVVAHRLGHPPEHIAVAHTAGWGPYRTHLVRQAVSRIGLPAVTLVPEPVSVARDYASKQHVEDNATLAVGNLGGSGFDATLLRRHAPGFEVIGQPLDSSEPSGQQLDDEVFAHVRGELGDRLAGLDPSDINARAALAQLRAECARGREALSHHPGTTLRIELPQGRTELGLSRARYEQLVRAHLERVPELLLQAAQSANLATEDLDAIVLAGGVGRTPLLKQLVGQRMDQLPLADAAPELVAARGAALSAVSAVSTDSDNKASVAETSVLMRLENSDTAGYGNFDDDDDVPLEAPRPSIDVDPMYIEPPDEARERKLKILKLTLAALLILGGLVLTIVQGFDGGGASTPMGVVQK